ncbi:hypothetical protein JCM8097_005631 [Rhodosporidiobolus ruineniae]
MRRIFGGSNLTNSSTSTSLASDALPSPTSAAHSHSQLGSDHGHGHTVGQQPDPPLTPTGTGTGEGPPGAAGKGWFGNLGAGLTRTASNTSTTPAVNGHAGGAGGGRHERSGSATSASFPGMSALLHHNTSKPSPSASSHRGSEFEDEELSPERLPFGQAARALSPSLGASPRSAAGAGGHTRASSRSSFGNLAGGGISRPFSPEGVLAHAEGPAGAGKGVQKDALLVELLSGAAALEAREFEVLDWEEMQEVKKEHALLSTRLTSLTRSLALETRLRDSAAKLVRLSAPSSSSPSPSPPPSASSSSRPSRPSVTREQATAQLATAQAKLESVQAEHHKLSAREAELRTKLLRHTAGVLALALRKKEEDDAAAALSAGLGSPLSASFPPSAGPNGTGIEQTPRAFDAPHFFAGNRDALDPLSHSSSRSNASPRGSPALSSSTHQHDAQALLNAQHDLAAAQQRVEELEADLARAREEQQRRDGEVEDARRAQREAEERVAEQEREAERRRREVEQREEAERGRREDEAAREREAREAVEREKSQLEDRLRSVEDELESVRSAAAAAARPPSPPPAQPEPATTATADVSSPRLAALESERSTLVQSIADVLRRHRTRAVLGPVFREAGPGLDDSPGSPLLACSPGPVPGEEGDAGLDLPNEVARTLDSHFAAASRHVESLQAQVEEHERNAAASTSSALAVEEELHGAHERMEHLEADLASVTNERDAAVLEGEQLRGELESLQGKVTSLGREAEKEEGMLEGARWEVEDVRRRLAGVEAAAEERARELAKLEELHGSLVTSAGERTTPSPVLPPRKSSKAGTMGGFLADVASKAKDAVTSSSSMSSITSASSVASSSPSTSPATTFSALPSTTTSATNGSFSVDSLVDRVKALLEEHRATSARLADLEAQVREKEQSGGQEKEGLERKVKDLEERIDYSSQAEVQMLERLNDLTESLESTRASKRQLEQRIATLEADLAAAQSAPASSATTAPAAGGGADDTELQELRDQIADLEEELADAQKREQKTRASLLDELSTAQSEVSSLKTQLRQAQRKAGGSAAR